jgi:hypothetical protein
MIASQRNDAMGHKLTHALQQLTGLRCLLDHLIGESE